MKKFLILQMIITTLTIFFTITICDKIYRTKLAIAIENEQKLIKENILNNMQDNIQIKYKIALTKLYENEIVSENFINEVRKNFSNDKYFLEILSHNKKVLDALEEYNTKKIYPVPLSYRHTDAKNLILEDITIFYCIPRYNENSACKFIYDKYFKE